MNSLAKLAVALTAIVACAAPASAATILFDLIGKAGIGLLSGNENGTIGGTPGSGGEIGSGISFDDVTFVMTLDVRWGSANGFSNLNGTSVTGIHIHGPTASSGTGSFTENAVIPTNLRLDDGRAGLNPSTSAGSFIGTATFTAAQVPDLLLGKFYFNVHTSTNTGGEIRGNLVRVVPEPASASLLGFGALIFAACRRRS